MEEQKPSVALVWGTGGIGSALAFRLLQQGKFERVVCVSRRAEVEVPDGAEFFAADFLDENSIKSVANGVRALGELQQVIVATGVLHTDEVQPEKSMRALSADNIEYVHRINCVGPVLVAKHLIPLMPLKKRVVFAAISARVGSISDNRLGGWHSYRASKASLNMMLKGLSIEWARKNPDSICVGLHPGTVDSALSEPFQTGVPAEKLFSPTHSAAMLVDTLDGLNGSDTGSVFDYAGKTVPA
ncbi:MAG: SDR family NAD(P)-dependent oxidoreductase [Kordiimonadaceae bacterium]|nr:SDR family NAD(P)-dependent oxidoreductase [Kordiimonadaceae bacterium]MBO6569951.1 SDR family NAD(P)-dependent oxidoreductase [Kordiimonadaceae bacterium]MBO6965952.1 SDR family NAD(P)-dependent oxidoreductase [Kordiimonadaceae bacterium]